MVHQDKIMKYINMLKNTPYTKPNKPFTEFSPEEMICQACYEFSLSDNLCAAAVIIISDYSIFINANYLLFYYLLL